MNDGSRGRMEGHDQNAPPKKRPSIRVTFTNMKAKMPLRRKLYLLVRNNWIKIRTRQSCCGHLGEPGC